MQEPGMEVPAENPLQSESPLAWQSLYEAMGPASLLVWLETRMGPELRRLHQPEDLLQDIWMRAWRARGEITWQGHSQFRRHLLLIGERRLRDLADAAKAKKRGGGIAHELHIVRGDSSGEAGLADVAFASSTPSRAAQEREHALAMLEGLNRLAVEDRELVFARIFEERPIAEIAARLGVGESGVRHRFRQAAAVWYREYQAILEQR